MASNDVFIWTADSRWLGGFGNLAAKENRRWWTTRQWLVQILVWLLIVNGVLALLLWISPIVAEQQGAGDKVPKGQDLGLMALTSFFSTLGIAPAIGVTILGQDAMINEKNHGTAAWVLSKPVSRFAFVLSKILCNTLGILITMVIVQGAVAYLQIWMATGIAYPLLGYAGAMGLVFLNLLFYLTLAVMLGVLSNSRGVAIGIPMLLILGNQFIIMIGPWLAEIMPWNLTGMLGATRPALALVLTLKQPLPTVMPLIATALWCILFTGVALWRFNREEF